ncbi:hypothetical protein KXR87_12990 [Yokenella regensburgei]|uniref:hypothetical protein n=1 Tax=Yokenella regensburgei TaxID=158877 RepID=UPI003F16F9D5
MITALLIFYAFMAGMTAEWSHTRLKSLGSKNGIALVSLGAGLAWPYFIWEMSR